MGLNDQEKRNVHIAFANRGVGDKVGKQLDKLHGGPADASFTIGSESSNTINVAIQFTDAEGNDCEERVGVPWYLSDNSNGDTLATAPDSGIAIGTDGLLIETLDNQAGFMVSESDGDVDVDISETTDTSFYLVLVMPSGKLVVSDEINFD